MHGETTSYFIRGTLWVIALLLWKFNIVPSSLSQLPNSPSLGGHLTDNCVSIFTLKLAPQRSEHTGSNAIAGGVWNLFSLFALYSSWSLQPRLTFNFILLELFHWCLKGQIKYVNVLMNERKYPWGLEIFWIIFSFFLAVSVMRYSASAFGFAVSNLKYTFMQLCMFSRSPRVSPGLSRREWLADESFAWQVHGLWRSLLGA